MTPEEAVQHIQEAVAFLQRKDAQAARARLEAVLRALPGQPDALHYMGVVCLASGDARSAIGWIERSLAAAPDNFAALNNLGVACIAAGLADRAIQCFNRSIQLQPTHPDAHLHLAHLLISAGKSEPAMRVLQRLVQIAPQHPTGHFLLATLLAQAEYLERAVASFRAHLQIQPNHAEAHGRLATVLAQLRRSEESVAAARRAVELLPRSAEAWNNLGWCLDRAGRSAEAAEAYRTALDHDPRFVMALGNLAAMHDRAGQPDEAIALFERARDVEPDNLDVLNALAGMYSRSGRYADALATAERALARHPHNPSARGHRAMALLSFGRYEEGFREYEWRWECKDFTTPVREFSQPRWTGRSDPSGRTILIHSEQGFGDTIQFARYLPLLADRGAKVIVECPVALCGLMETVRGVHKVVAAGVRPPPFELQAPLLSLPHAFGTALETIPRELPYFHVPAEQIHRWRDRLNLPAGQKSVGLVWRGNSKPNPKRSIPLSHFRHLSQITGCTFISLQVGAQGDEADNPPEGLTLLDLRHELKDFLDTAAVMTQLDLVITIDTAAAHLAGALGVPTWTLLIRAADWRWMQEREDSPWYPGMRLFRQQVPDRWDDVIERVRAELAGWAVR